MRRLLMISPHFPPDSSAGTHRVRLLAPHLAAYGWTATVLTVAAQDYEGRTDPELAGLVPGSLEVVRSRALPARLTRCLGVGDLGLRALPGLRRAAWQLQEAHPFDAVFITIYPTYPAVLGPMIKRRHRVPFILDYQDPWVGAWGKEVGGGEGGAVDPKSRSTRALAERLEPSVLRAASGVTAVSARIYEDAFERTGITPCEVAEIPIGWDPADVEALERRGAHPQLIPADGRVNICYTGTLLPLGIATLRAVLAGARALIERDPQLADRIRFYFFGTSNQTTGGAPRVIPHARDLGVEHLVHEQPARLDYLDALDVLRQADALLLLGSSERHYTPSKIFPALLANRPLLAVYRRESTAVDMLSTAAPPPAAHVITFDDDHPVESIVGCVAESLRALIGTAGSNVRINRAALEPWSARTLAGRLAGLCDRIAA
jgi:glycosyltransferase involved in cell wall biosynthesis